jgi:signal transduction histidine kinase
MKAILDYSLAPYSSHNNPTTLIHYLLDGLANQIDNDYACVVSRAEDLRLLEYAAEHVGEKFAEPPRSAVEDLLNQQVNAATPASEPIILQDSALQNTGFRSALLFPLAMPDEVLGILALFSTKPDAYAPEQVNEFGQTVALIRTMLENIYMYNVMAQNMIVTQSIQLAAREIANNPSPQHVVNILRDYFFDAHVTSCAMLLFGPVGEGDTDGAYEYLEVKGTWSKRRGSGVGVGVRFYLNDLPDLLEQLDNEKLLTFPRAKELTVRLDPLLRIFLQAERVRSICLLALNASQRKLGVIFVGTDKRHDFTAQELHSYRTVSEFLAINVMTQMLQVQHDRVQQGRASLLDAVTDGVLMVEPSADGARVLTANPQFQALFELPGVPIQDLPLADLIDRLPVAEMLRDELRKTWLNIPVRDPMMQKGEFTMIHSEGHRMDIEWYSAPVYQGAYVLGRIYIFHDVTSERTATRLRADFLSRVSHELRTPLTSIGGSAEFILEATRDKLPDLAREYLEIILRSAKHLNHVFDDIIQISRADAGALKLERQEAHVPDIVIDVVARMEINYKQHNKRVVMELDDDLPPVSVDINRIIQVLTNLMTNAIKYSPPNSTIHISTDYVAKSKDLPSSAPPDVVLPAVMVTVADEGTGLSKEDAEKIFLPFYRTEAATKAKIEGVGLGLAVTRSFVEMHRGKIWAEAQSKEHPGTAFIFTLPTIDQR